MSDKLTKDTAIAHRVLELKENPSEKVDVFIGNPFQLGKDEWACPYRIVGGGIDLNLQIIGVDSVQALQLVFPIIDSAIVGTDVPLLWDGEEYLGFAPK